jgi:hypothetical protein
MQNGTYRVEFRPATAYYKMVAYNGKLRLFNVETGVHVRDIRQHEFDSFYRIVEKLAEDRRYDIDWMVNGRLAERIKLNANYPVVKWKINQLATSTHSVGKLIPRRVI